MSFPKIEPIKLINYTSKQSKYDHCAKLPMRSILLGASGSGKTVLLQNMILDIYRGCFEKIYVFSPSVYLDGTWLPVKDYIENEMKVKHTKEDLIYFDEYIPSDLEKIIDTQRKITEYMKQQKLKKMYNILIIIDDFADDPSFCRHSKLLHSLYTRGRHSMISTCTATQVYNCISPIIRKNATELYVYRLRNAKDLECVIDELSALLDKKTLLQMYNLAVSEPYSFFSIFLTAKNLNDMFYIRLEKKLIPE